MSNRNLKAKYPYVYAYVDAFIKDILTKPSFFAVYQRFRIRMTLNNIEFGLCLLSGGAFLNCLKVFSYIKKSQNINRSAWRLPISQLA